MFQKKVGDRESLWPVCNGKATFSRGRGPAGKFSSPTFINVNADTGDSVRRNSNESIVRVRKIEEVEEAR